MAIIEYSGLVSGMKGILGGSVLQDSPAGWIIKNNRSWNKQCSSAWSAQKAVLASIAQDWRTLTQAQRDTWDAAASSFPFTDKYGNSYTASGYQVFMSLNTALSFIGQSTLTTAPTAGSVHDIGTLTLGAGGGVLLDASWVNAIGSNDTVAIFASAPLSQGSSFRQGMLPFMALTSVTSATNVNIYNEYIARYGHLPSGSRVWCKSIAYNETTGQHGMGKTACYDVP